MYPKEGKRAALWQLQSISWSRSSVGTSFTGLSNEQGKKTLTEERDYLQEAQLWQSTSFQELWQAEETQISRLGAQELLVLAMESC